MKYWSLLLATGLACANAGATATEPVGYSCKDPSISKIVVSSDYSQMMRDFNAARDPSERKKHAARLRGTARTATERDLATFAGAIILASEQKYAEAEEAYTAVAASRVVARDTTDSARIALAYRAIDRKDYDSALAWLEPMVTAGCKTVEDGARRGLAFLYQEKGRLADALEQVDEVKYASEADADHWRAARIDFRCALEGETGCMEQIASLAGNGDLGTPKALEAANRQIARMGASESGRAALAHVKKYGVLDEQGQLINSKVEGIVPLKRAKPQYPREAYRQGISGYVDVAFVINPDGTVKSVEVWDSRPMKVFDRAALAAARRTTFKPKLVNGHPVESSGLQRYQFVMGP